MSTICTQLWAFAVLLLLPIDLHVAAYTLKLVLQMTWFGTKISIPRGVFCLSFSLSYFFFDTISSVCMCLVLYGLTANAPVGKILSAASIVRYGGILIVLFTYVREFPIKAFVKTVWPLLERFDNLPAWVRHLNGIALPETIGDVFKPLYDGMCDTANHILEDILCGVVGPYVGVLAATCIVDLFRKILPLPPLLGRLVDLLMFTSDTLGALFIVFLSSSTLIWFRNDRQI